MKKILILYVILLSSCYHTKTFDDLPLQEQCIYRAKWDFDKCNRWWSSLDDKINMKGNDCLIAFNIAENNCKNVYKDKNEMGVE